MGLVEGSLGQGAPQHETLGRTRNGADWHVEMTT